MLANAIRQTTTSTGAAGADLTLASVSGYPTFHAVFGTRPFYYGVLADADGTPVQWGIGHMSDSTTLVQDKILATYTGGTYDDTTPSAVTLSGTSRVICVAEAHALMAAPLNVNTSATNRAITPYAPSSAGTLAITANRCYYIPVLINTPREIDAIFFRIGTAGATGTQAKVGLYSATKDGKPGDRIDQSAFVSTGTSTGGTKATGTLTSRRYPPGLYFMAISGDGTPTLNTATASNAHYPLLGIGSDNAAAVTCLYEALSGGWTDLPATASGTLTEVTGTGNHPLLSLRIAS